MSALKNLLSNGGFKRAAIFGMILIIGSFFFEISNYFTTWYALSDILGEIRFGFMTWATILSIAFVAVDLGGIARLFTPEEGKNEPEEVWYLFGAWMLAATFDACLSWWSIKLAIVSNPVPSKLLAIYPNAINLLPVIGAGIELVIRILLINRLATHGEKLLGMTRRPQPKPQVVQPQSAYRPFYNQQTMPNSIPRRNVPKNIEQ